MPYPSFGISISSRILPHCAAHLRHNVNIGIDPLTLIEPFLLASVKFQHFSLFTDYVIEYPHRKSGSKPPTRNPTGPNPGKGMGWTRSRFPPGKRAGEIREPTGEIGGNPRGPKSAVGKPQNRGKV